MNLDLGEVLSRAWQISWKHKSFWLFGIFLGLFILAILPLAFVLPFGFIEQKANWTIISIALLGTAVFVSIFVVFNGWALGFMKSVWVLTYLRLTGDAKSRPALLEAPS